MASAVGVEAGIDVGWHRQWVQRYVEDYLLQLNALPDGPRRVQVYWGGYKDLGNIDFGRPEKIASGSLVPGRSWEKLEPEDKTRFLKLLPYQRQIDAIAAGILDQHLKFGWGWHCVWTHRFIGDHLLKTRQLPEGNMQFTTQWPSRYRGRSDFLPADGLVQRWPVHDLEREDWLWHPDRPRRRRNV